MIKHCAFVGFSHGCVWWHLHSCSPHSCPRSALAHNFTAEWPGTNDKAPHPSYLCCLRSSVYVCGVFVDILVTILSLQTCATQEQVHMTLRWLRDKMDGRVDRGCAYPSWHFYEMLCMQVKLLTEVRKWNTGHGYVKPCRPAGCLGVGSEDRNLARAKSVMTWWRLCFISAQCTQHGSTWEPGADESCVPILHCSALPLSGKLLLALVLAQTHTALSFFIYKHFSTSTSSTRIVVCLQLALYLRTALCNENQRVVSWQLCQLKH